MIAGCSHCGEGFMNPVCCEECEHYFDEDDMQPINGDPHCPGCYDSAIEKYLTQEQCVAMFEESFPEQTFMGARGIDCIARAEAFNDYCDMLCKDGQLTQELYHSMDNPY